MLLAGEGTRMRPLTYTKPKPLLKICGKTILEHNLEQLKHNGIKDIVIVLGYLANEIETFLKNSKIEMNFEFVLQKNQLGTGDAVLQAEKFIKDEKFLVLYGDDYYHRDDIKECLSSNLCVTAKRVSDPERFGVFVVKNDKVVDIIEKPKEIVSNLANTGLYVLNREVFTILKQLKPSERNEIELTDAVRQLLSKYSVECKISSRWMPIGYPWDLLAVNEEMMKELKVAILDKEDLARKNITLEGSVKIGKGTVIRSGSYIEGPVIIGDDCVIGPNCFIRPNTFIGDRCRIGNAVEIKNCIIGNDTKIEHLSYIGDSIIGDNCNFGAGTITANLRHDNKTIRVHVKETLVDTMRRKLGIIMGDFTKIGVHTSLYPGIKLGPFSWTTPGAIVKENIEPLTLLDGTEKKSLLEEKFDPKYSDKIKFVKGRLQ